MDKDIKDGILAYINRMAKNNFKGVTKEGLIHLLSYGELLGQETKKKLERAINEKMDGSKLL